MIYAFNVALEAGKRRRRRGAKQDDNALLPGEFLGRWCLLVHAVYTGAVLRILRTALPPHRGHVSQELGDIRGVWFTDSLPWRAGGVRCPPRAPACSSPLLRLFSSAIIIWPPRDFGPR